MGLTNGGVVDWATGNKVVATMIGYENVAPNAGVDTLFGYTRYKNLTPVSANNKTTLRKFDSAEAGGSLGAWNSIIGPSGDPLFGRAEGILDVAVVSMTDFVVAAPTPALGAVNPDYIANSAPALTSTSGLSIADTDFNQWTVANGVFSVTCPTFADSCAAADTNENGLFQRIVVVAGEQYFQTIIVKGGSITGDPSLADFAIGGLAFKDETFVKVGGGNGVAGRMRVAERGTDTAYLTASNRLVDMPTTAGDFTFDTKLNAGWANRGSVFVARDMNGDGVIDVTEGTLEPQAVLAVNQRVFVPAPFALDSSSMEGRFTLERGATEADVRMSLYTRVGSREGADGFVRPIEVQTVTVAGAYQRTDRATIDGIDVNTLPDVSLLPSDSTQDVSWVAGDALKATWVGGQYGTTSPALTTVGTTSFTNLTTGEGVSATSLEVVNPENWFVDPFLEKPVYP